MKRLIKKAIIDIRTIYDSWEEFELELINGNSFEPFEQYYVPIDFKNYLISIEGWYPDCLESIDYGETTPSNIKMYSQELLERQFGYLAERHNYLQDSQLSEYGVSYIAKEVDI